MLSGMKAILSIESGDPMPIQARLAAFTRPQPLIYFTATTNTITTILNSPSYVDGTADSGMDRGRLSHPASDPNIYWPAPRHPTRS